MAVDKNSKLQEDKRELPGNSKLEWRIYKNKKKYQESLFSKMPTSNEFVVECF